MNSCRAWNAVLCGPAVVSQAIQRWAGGGGGIQLPGEKEIPLPGQGSSPVDNRRDSGKVPRD